MQNSEQFDSNINLHITSYDSKSENKATNVTVNKYAKAENGNFKFYYDITTPRVDDYLFILALDSSGSFAYNSADNPDRQAKAVIGAVPEFLKNTINNYKNRNFKLSIISWDNDLDFAYKKGDFNNNDTSNIELVPIRDVVDDIAKLSPFVEPDKEGIPYRCEEKEFTDLSQPIKASLEILDSEINKPNDTHRVKPFIIIVTGQGEFARCEPIFIEYAKGIPIYVVGMEFRENTKMWNHLVYDICGNPDNFFRTPSNSNSLRDDLLSALNSALGKAISDPVASNVSIVEPIDKCFAPDEKTVTAVIKTDPNKKIQVISKINQSSIEFQLPGGLYPENVTELAFDARFALDFPVSDRDKFLPSRLSYTWFNNRNFNISIPKNVIRIDSQIPTTSASSDSDRDKGKSSSSGEIEKAEGFGILQLLMAIAFCLFIKNVR